MIDMMMIPAIVETVSNGTQVSKCHASGKSPQGSATSHMEQFRITADGAPDVFEFCSSDDDAPMVTSAEFKCGKGRGGIKGGRQSGLASVALSKRKGGRASASKRALVLTSSSSSNSSSENDDVADINISEEDCGDVAAGSCDVDGTHNFQSFAFEEEFADDLSADDYAAACAAEYLDVQSVPNASLQCAAPQGAAIASSAAASRSSGTGFTSIELVDSAKKLAEQARHDAQVDDLTAQMMDHPENYRQHTPIINPEEPVLSRNCAPRGRSRSSAPKLPAATKPFVPAASAAGSPISPVASVVASTSSAASPAYPPGSELRLRAKRAHESNHHILKEVFGFDDFRDKQEDVINLVLMGQSCL
jgi:hypothetical protein